MRTKYRGIPPSTYASTSRGGGSETIKYVSNGPMELTRSFTRYVPSLGTGANSMGQYYFINPGGVIGIGGTAPSESSIRSSGTHAIAASRPDDRNLSILRSSAELGKDGIPLYPGMGDWESKTGYLRTLGSYHLAVQFGWLPLASDVLAFAARVQNQNAILAQHTNTGSSNWNSTKVGYRFPTDTNVVTTSGDGYPGYKWVSGALQSGVSLKAFYYKQKVTETWFEGEYQTFIPTMRLPEQEYLNDTTRKASILLNTALTPRVLWDLAPWSWAVDWFSNTGDMISAISEVGLDGLVLRNGFIMSHWYDKCEVSWGNASGASPAWRVGGGSAFFISEVKKRYPAVPYFGFGLPGGLSAKQVSILAALGLNRL